MSSKFCTRIILHGKDFISQIHFNHVIEHRIEKNKLSKQSLNGHVRVDEMSKNVWAMSIEGASWKKYNYGEIR